MTLEYQAILVALALAIYLMVRNRRAILPFAGGALAPAIALGAYHTALFGRPWTLPYANIENPVFAQTAHKAGFDGLSLPHLEAFPAFLISPAYGLFAFSPVLILGLAGAIFLVARGPRREAVLTLVIAASMFMFIAGMSNWRGGWCVGPRYIATVAPFLLLPLVQLWPRLAKHAVATAAIVGLTIPSVLLNVVSGALYPHYPEQFDNPVFDLAFPLVGAGFTPYGLGWLLGPAGDLGDGAARAGGAGRAGAWWPPATTRVRAGPVHTWRSRWRSPACFSCRSPPTAARRASQRRTPATIVRAMWDPPRGAPIPESRR